MTRSIFLVLLIVLNACSDSEKTDKEVSENSDNTIESTGDTLSDTSPIDTSVVPYSYRAYYDFDDSQLLDLKTRDIESLESKLSLGVLDGELYPNQEPFSKDIDLSDKSIMVGVDHFDPQEVLEQLFPGEVMYLFSDFHDIPEDSIRVIFWNCLDCDKVKVEYCNNDHWGTTFPGDKSNTTLLTGDYEFSLGQKDYRLLSFASYADQFGISFTGRFNGSDMGAAVFEEHNDQYVLIDFMPVINSFGSYNSISNPEIRIEGDHAFLIYGTYNGGAGGPYNNSDEILMFDGSELLSIAQWDFLSLANVNFGKWHYQYSFEANETGACPNAIVEITGYYIGKTTGDEERLFVLEDAPESFIEACKEADLNGSPFAFYLERVYSFEDGRYIESETKLEQFPLSGEWKSRD